MEDVSFINAVSNIVTQGSSGAKGTTPHFEERSNNFKLLLGHFQLVSIDRPSQQYISSQSQANMQQKSGVVLWIIITGTLSLLL